MKPAGRSAAASPRRAPRRSRRWPSQSRRVAPLASVSWPACTRAAVSRCSPTAGRPPSHRWTRGPNPSGPQRRES
eukprot:1796739-Pyramimonas_sp.AAC.1